MLGLVSHTNLMDALVHPRRHVTGLSLITSARPPKCYDNEFSEPDPVLEDTPGTQDIAIDHSIHPPDIGHSVLLGADGVEIALCETPAKQCKRVLCSFSCHNLPEYTDSDEYPFHAISYGETDNCFGLPYNDHTYAKNDQKEYSLPFPEPEDRLSLLAKLALAKDDKISETDMQSSNKHEIHLTLTSTANTTEPIPGSEFIQVNPVHPGQKPSLMYNSELQTIPSNAPSSLVTTSNRIPPPGNRTILLSTVRNNSNPPLQIHRVTSSITPHVVLRTGLPALQITTTAPRQIPAQSNDTVRCVCGNNNMDGYLIQCDQCRVWQHSECVSLMNKGHLSTPYACERCQSHLPRMRTVTVQQQKLTTINGTGALPNPNVRISRATPLTTNNTPGRILVTAPFGNTTRQVHVCLPTTQSLTNVHRADFNVTSCSSVKSIDSYGSQVNAMYQPSSQSMRSSKRKQDLITLTGGPLSSNVGLEGFSTSPPPVSESFNKVSDNQKSYPVEMKNCPTSTTLSAASVTTNTHGSLTITDNGDLIPIVNASPLQRLILDYPNNSVHESITASEHHHTTSPCSTNSSESLTTSPTDVYEEATELRLSDRLYHRLDSLLPSFTGLNSNVNDSSNEVLGDEALASLKSMARCQVVSFDFNRKGLVATEDISPHSPILEYRGVCMLLTEYNDMYDYRKHYNPFVLFYKTWSKLALCIDARKYGNEARFIRRSCTPNCEVRHSISFASNRVSGTTPHIRLFVVARRPIGQSCELTLPFDFDYTACRYLVKCACIRKACPVTRWFQRMNQLNSNIQSPTRNSLIYSSRKIPLSPRSGINVKAQDFDPMSNSQTDYSDRSTEDIGRSSLFNRAAGAMNNRSASVRNLIRNPTDCTMDRSMEDNYSPRTANKPNIKESFSLHSERRKFPHRRGRGRGRARGSHSSTLINRFNNDRISCRFVNRGRPGKRRSLTTTRKRRVLHRSIFSHETKFPKPLVNQNSISSPKFKTENINGYASYSSDKTSYQGSDDVCNKVDDLKYGEFKHEQRYNNVYRTNDNHNDDDLDADTEPEYENGRNELNVNHTTSPKKSNRSKRSSQFMKSETESSTKQQFNTRNSSSEQMNFDDDASVKSSNENNEVFVGTVRNKRRSYGDATNLQKSHSKKVVKSNKDGSGEKSREEVWMAEVLRRIERMEKKRLKRRIGSELRKPSAKSSSLDINNQSELNSRSDDEQQQPSADSLESPVEPITHVIETKKEVLSTPDSVSPEKVTCIVNKTPDKKLSPNFDINTTTSYSDEKSSLSNVNAMSPECRRSVECMNSENDVSFAQFRQSKKKIKSRRNSKSSRNLSPQQRRRRSQTAMLSDGLSNGSVDQSGSREDRWLQFQLRRIAELEDQTELSQATSWDLENALSKRGNNSVIDPTVPMDSASSNVPLFEALGMKVCPPDPVLSTIVKFSSGQLNGSANHRHHISPRLSSTGAVLDQDTNVDHLESKDKVETTKQDVGDGERNLFDSEADCELIVYRAREKDPMAKFSRGRIATSNSQNLNTSENGIVSNPYANRNQEETAKHELTLSYTARPILDQTLRPTKKRWLSRALMEDVESSTISSIKTSSDSTVLSSKAFKSESSPGFNMQAIPNSGPVNPKKRIISQLSEYVEDSGIFQAESDYTVQSSELKLSQIEIKNKSNTKEELCSGGSSSSGSNTDNTQQLTNHAHDDKESNHPLPLPPKKATVKQQAEALRLQEMRKVRVSLSEYRRRRGLPSLSTSSISEHNNRESNGHAEQTPDIDDLEINIPQDLMSPNQLLNSLPRFKNEPSPIKQCEQFNSKANIPYCNDMFNELRVYTPSLCESEHQPVLLTDEKLNERGPRTPSEPPDEEDHGVGLDMNSPNHDSKVALSSSPEPYVQFAGKACSANGSPISPSFDMQINTGKLLCRNRSPPTDNKITNKEYSKFNPVTLPLSVATQIEDNIQDQVTSSASNQDYYSHSQTNFELRNVSHSADGLNFSPSVCSPSSNVSYSDLPPPPPPPPLPSFSGYQSTRSNSKSPSCPNYDVDKNPDDGSVRSHCALQYFIKRDHEIRVWQETRSHEREWKQTSNQWNQRNTQPRSFQARKPCPPLTKSSLTCNRGSDRNLYRDDVSGQFDNVEQTLWRIRDNLQAQLELTKHKNPSSNPPSAHGSGNVR